MGTARCRRRALALVVAAAALSVGVLWAESGLACTIAYFPADFVLSAKGEGTGEPPSPPQLKQVLVERSRQPPPGLGDCSEFGSLALVFAVGERGMEAHPVGIGLKVIKGALPERLQFTGGPYAPEKSTLKFHFPDYPDKAFSFTLAARAVDAMGNESSPVEVVVKGDPQPSRSTGGCSMSSHLGHSQAWGQSSSSA